jgi:hypothetical protein
MRERTDQRADAEYHQGQNENPLLAEHVAEAARDRGRDGGRQQERRQREGDGRGRGMQLALDLGQRRGDDRL